jgi:hypothetical protein
MTYTVTSLGLQLPDPGTGQAWQTSVYNANLQKINDAIAALAGVQVRQRALQQGAPNVADNTIGSTYNFPATTITIPNGQKALLRVATSLNMRRQATAGSFAGNLHPVVNSVNQSDYRMHTHDAGTGVSVVFGKVWTIALTGTGQPIPIRMSFVSDAASVLTTIGEYDFDWTLEY